MQFLRSFLEWKYLNGILWVYVIVTMGLHFILYGRKVAEGEGIIYKHFGPFADACFAVITYGLNSSTSVTLLKGVYIQQAFGDIKYFNEFSSIDIYSILVVCTFLFGYSLFRVTKTLQSVFYYAGAKEVVPYSGPLGQDKKTGCI